MYPNARFIFIHRHPHDVYASNKRFWGVVNKRYTIGKTAKTDIHNIILDTYCGIMDSYLEQRGLIPDGQLVELKYSEFIQAPLQAVRDIYTKLQLNDFSNCEDAMRSFIESQKSFKRLRHELSENEREHVKKRLEPYVQELGYNLE